MPLKLPKKKTNDDEGSSDSTRRARMKKKLAKIKEKGKGGKFLRLKDGETVKIRILPPIEKNGDWYFESGNHFSIGPEKISVPCPKLNSSSPCPICDKVKELYDAGDEKSKKIAGRIRVVPRNFCNVFTKEKGVKILGMSDTLTKDILKFFVDPNWGDLDDIKEGRWIELSRTGEGFDTEYDVLPNPNKKPLEDAEDILEERKVLSETQEMLEEEEMAELLEATDFEALAKGGSKKKKDSKKEGSRKEDD